MSRQVPTCRVVLNLGGVSWGSDAAAAVSMLQRRPGVLSATVDPRTRRAVVVHDSRTSLPDLWNWLVECGAHCAGQSPREHQCLAATVRPERLDVDPSAP